MRDRETKRHRKRGRERERERDVKTERCKYGDIEPKSEGET